MINLWHQALALHFLRFGWTARRTSFAARGPKSGAGTGTGIEVDAEDGSLLLTFRISANKGVRLVDHVVSGAHPVPCDALGCGTRHRRAQRARPRCAWCDRATGPRSLVRTGPPSQPVGILSPTVSPRRKSMQSLSSRHLHWKMYPSKRKMDPSGENSQKELCV